MVGIIDVISKIIRYLSKYPKIGTFFGTIFGLLEVPILDSIYFVDKYIHPGSYQALMKTFSIFYGSKVIPLNKKIESELKIIPTDEILNLINRMQAVRISYCYCRSKYQKCQNPIWSCIHIGTAKHLNNLSNKIPLKNSNIDEVKQLLIKADELGLVHQLLTAPTANYVYVICNCCPCCCVMLRNAIELKIHGAVLPSNFIVNHNNENCINCGNCIYRCYFNALKMENSNLSVDIARCVGCGLCISYCRNNALKLVRKIKN